MAEAVDAALASETDRWCRSAEEALAHPPEKGAAWLVRVRDGVRLRRRWDAGAAASELRRDLLCVLTRLQTAGYTALADWARPPPQDDSSAEMRRRRATLVEAVLDELAESDAYLAGLLADRVTDSETLARAVEAFRDDLHWLAGLVAVLDGTAPPDLVGRALAEQEAIVRAMEAAPPHDATGAGQGGASETPDSARRDLRRIARELRRAALEQRIRALLADSPPEDHGGWFARWRAAGRLVVYSERPTGAAPASPDSTPRAAASGTDDLVDTLRAHHEQCAAAWQRAVAKLHPELRSQILDEACNELMDAASDALTFLEDLPLDEQVRTLEILADDLAVCRSAVAEAQRELPDAVPLKRLARKLKRRRSSVRAELQERQLAYRLERRFGHRTVAAIERIIFALLLVFVGLLILEAPLLRWEANQGWGRIAGSGDPAPGPVEATLAWIDLGICLVFLAEFGLKFAMVGGGRASYLRRHWLTGLLPAIPFGFFAYATHHAVLAGYAEEFVLLRALRYLRLPRMVRWLRVARPLVRAGRLVAFVLRAGDRLARQLAPVLNRNLVLFERADLEVDEPEYRIALAGLRERFIYRSGEVQGRLGTRARLRVGRCRMEDLSCILQAAPVGVVTLGATIDVASSREIPIESVVARLLTATPAQVGERVGVRVAEQITRWCRAYDLPLVRRVPLLSEFVHAGRLRDPCEATARVANQLGLHLKRALDGAYWCADLYGTLTAPQMVDALGDWLVKGTARPTRRLLLLGGSFLLVSYLASLMPVAVLQQLSDFLGKFVAGSLLVVGLLCLVPLSLGIWFRRIAGQATEFYDQVAEAQYLGATRTLKQRLAESQHAVLHRRVVEPELRLLALAAAPGAPCSDSDSDKGAASQGAGAEQQRRVGETVERLWNDYLDGAPFHRSDTKTTTQLLGNLVLVSLRESRLRYNRGEQKRLRRLDLERERGSFAGPYLWFHFISRSLAQHSAKLVVDYNAHAIPLSRAATAGDADVDRYVNWLAKRLGVPPSAVSLPEPFQARALDRTSQPGAPAPQPAREMRFHGNDFTTEHFLSADEALHEEVRRRYGETVAALLARDRRDNVRRVFRSFPFHHWPKEKRTFNPLMFYQRHLDGGRILLAPLKIIAWICLYLWRGTRMVAGVVKDVLNPVEIMLSGLRDADPFAVAVRKIHRMRKPVFLECLRMRARFDPEYLGIALHGLVPGGDGSTTGRPSAAPIIEQDLDRIDAGLRVRDEIRRLAARRRRQLHDFTRWFNRLDWDGPSRSPAAEVSHREQPAPAQIASNPHSAFRTPRSAFSPESLRAMAVAYCVNYRNLRTQLESTETLQRAFDEIVFLRGQRARRRGAPLRRAMARTAMLVAHRPRVSAQRLRRLFAQPAFARYQGQQRKWCCKLLRQQRGPHVKALRRLTHRNAPADPVDDARRKLLAVARDPATWTQQMLVLRTVQTLTVLDLQTYCDLARELGEYEST